MIFLTVINFFPVAALIHIFFLNLSLHFSYDAVFSHNCFSKGMNGNQIFFSVCCQHQIYPTRTWFDWIYIARTNFVFIS